MFDVYLHDVRVGTLTPRGRGVRFTYDSAALTNDELPALSLSLPKRAEPFPDSQAGPFFRNLLPEQAYRRLVAAGVGTAAENSLALLGAIGGECPGAVSLWPKGSAPPANPEYQRLTADELRALFSASDRQAFATAIARGRLSLAGVQEKIALLRDESGSWHLPLKGAVTSHILKQAATAFPNVLENELFCMELAKAAGLDVAPTGLAAPEVRVFCAERFDRPPSHGPDGPARLKLHQEDFCQILRVEPDRKYEADGGPGLKKCAEVIRRHSGLPARDLERLVRWVGFNYLIGNEDAHAKNLALLYRTDGLRLTPHYDLVSTEVYAQLERKLAMKIGRSWDIRSVQRDDWRRVADALGLPWESVRTSLLELWEVLAMGYTETRVGCTRLCGESPVYEAIAGVLRRRGEKLEQELAHTRGS
jgi:serine/threonine-protein kinase HipA